VPDQLSCPVAIADLKHVLCGLSVDLLVFQ